jgi:predicted Rossmann fold nucleotide-binding protein DprA/Smf involved in DNA uptake
MDSNVDDPTCQACKALIIQNQQLMLDTTTINEMSQPIGSRQYKQIEREAIQAQNTQTKDKTQQQMKRIVQREPKMSNSVNCEPKN